LFISKLTIILVHDRINEILVRISSSPIAVLLKFYGKLLIFFFNHLSHIMFRKIWTRIVGLLAGIF
jgi:hypothetical protein